MLEVKGVTKYFGGLCAVHDCTLSVEADSITGLIGPNGAGKTTLFNVIAGVYPPNQGEVWFRGEKISDAAPWAIAGKGVARTFQTPHGFPQMTIMENLMVSPLRQKGEGVFRGLLRGARVRAEEKAHRRKALELLDTIGMVDRRNELVVNLSAGEARMVELVRQLMLDPQILLLDEPAAGINPALCGKLLDLLRRLRHEGLTLLVIDHNLSFIMELCDTIYVLSHGEVTPAAVSADPKVIEAYLGRAA
ncbi:MAG: ABC transporter ATP-binding protein [Actinobacteria bacterium]|nr:ABC transporter ATP-binding protein [Actinomycetota bacterium]